jgi:hypothetical protein
MLARLAHASMLGDGKQDMQVAQPDALSDPVVPIQSSGH